MQKQLRFSTGPNKWEGYCELQIQGKQGIISGEHRHLILFKVSDGIQAIHMGLKGGTWEGGETCIARSEQSLAGCSILASQDGLFLSNACLQPLLLLGNHGLYHAGRREGICPTECMVLSPELAWGLAETCSTWQRFCITSWNDSEAKISDLGF